MRPVASRAFFGPMNTGACTYVRPRCFQRSTRSPVGVGAVVVWSVMTAVGRMRSASGSRTESTAASSLSVRWISDAPRTAVAASSNATAPSACSAWAFSGVRFQTCTVSPRSSILRTKLAPSSPVPSHAIKRFLLV